MATSRLQRIFVYFVAFLLMGGAPSLSAQGTGASLAVRVTEAGTPVAGAEITVRNGTTGFSTGATASSSGSFVFTQLPLGPYSITAGRIGLRSQTREGIALTIGARVDVDLDLDVAPVALDEVVVTGARALRSKGIGATWVAPDALATLPAAGRNFTDLASLAPTVGAEGSIGGARATSTDIRIDGLQARNMLRGGELGRGPYTLSMEAIREFEVVTNLYDVSQGRQGGGAIVAATKSGTNELEGSLFTYYRGDRLGAAQDYLGRGRELRRLDLFQWGGSVGGPIGSDRLHFFVAADRQNSTEPLAIADLRNTADQLELQIAADSVARLIDILHRKYGLPTTPQIGVFERDPVAMTLFGRIDWQPSPRHLITIRHNYSSFDSPYNGVGDQLISLFESRSSSHSTDHQTLASLRSTLGASVQNELKVGLSIADRDLVPNTLIPRGFVRIRSKLPDGSTGDVRVQFGGNRLAPEQSGERQVQLLNTTYWQRGNQLFTVGVDNSLTFLKTFIPTDEGGLFEFGSLGGLDSLNATRYTRQVPITGVQPRARQYVLDAGVFAQSEWRTSPRFSATLGVRYDLTAWLTGAPENALVEQKFGLRTDNTPIDWNNLQPRAQVVWEPSANDALRIGGGAFSIQPHYYLQANNIFFSGTQLADLSLATGIPVPDFARYRADLASVPGVPAGMAPPAYVNVMGANFQSPMEWKADVTWTHRFGAAVRVSGTLLASLTRQNYQYFDRNLRDAPAFTLDNEQGRAVFVPASTITAAGATNVRNAVKVPEFTNVLELVSTSSGSQKGAVLQLDLEPAGWAHLSASYTYNRAFDYSTFSCCIARTASLLTPVKSDPRDLAGSWGPSDYDFRHKIAAEGELTMWGTRVGARYVGNSGRPFSLTVNGDINGDGYSGNDLAFIFDPENPITPPDIAASMRKLLANENSSARDYIRANLGRIADRNGGHAPWTQRVDVRIVRPVSLPHTQAVELTADVFNFLNLFHSEWGGQYLLPQGISASNPTTQQLQLLNVVGFDQVTRRYRYTVNESVGVLRKRGDPYQIQLGARYRFR